MNKKKIANLLQKYFSNVWYYYLYYKAAKKIGYNNKQKNDAFARLLELSKDKKCLQIGVRRKKFSQNWVSVDLYDKSDCIDYNYDIHDLKFVDNTFDAVVCNAVLEHVENPQKAISELHRVLKPGGLIWVEVPFNQPYHGSPNDFWRVTLAGIRIWLSDFEEISAGYFSPTKSPIHNGVYFNGKK
ncbi:class I SAM-dependent methyltransferase [Patescibacteria group bacterium]|nr:class I SAM-dependent methyltransferase [Patescibacteria group bacterium]